jgi:hypothetical protein
MQSSPNTTISAADRRHNQRVILILVGMLMLGLASIVWALTWDIDAPDTTDLETPPALNMAGEDFYDVIKQIIYRVPYDDIRGAAVLFQDARREGKWNQAGADRLLRTESATTLWPLIDRALNAKRGRSDWGTMADHHILYILSLSQFMGLHALDMAKHGNPDNALNEALKILALGKRISDSGTSVTDFLCAQTVQAISISCIRALAKEHSFSEAAMRHALGEIRQNHLTARDAYEILRGEFALTNSFIKTLSNPENAKDLKINSMPVIKKIVFKKNLTQETYASHIREIGTLLMGDYTVKNMADLTARATTQLSPTGYKRYINADGNYISKLFEKEFNPGMRRWAEVESSLSVAETFFALRLYQLKNNGALPESLDLLVQTGHMPSIPKEYIDGQAIRYSKERRIVWTIGRNNWNPPFPQPDDGDYDAAESGIFRLDWPDRQTNPAGRR